MPGQLVCELERSHPVALIRPRGVLDAVTAQELRATVLEALLELPTAVVLDTTELVLVDDVGVVVLATVARECRRWPGAPIVLGGPSDGLLAAAQRQGNAGEFELYPDVAGALAEAQGRGVPPWARVRLDPTRYAPALAREELTNFCARWGVPAEHEAPAVIVSELVTNAVVHTNTAIDVTLRLTGPILQIAVRDLGGGRVHLVPVTDESSDHGRGLVLVDALASAWGTFVPRYGKVVWATVPLAARPSSSEKAD
jgi:anti-anti-sigma regulatory factor